MLRRSACSTSMSVTLRSFRKLSKLSWRLLASTTSMRLSRLSSKRKNRTYSYSTTSTSLTRRTISWKSPSGGMTAILHTTSRWALSVTTSLWPSAPTCKKTTRRSGRESSLRLLRSMTKSRSSRRCSYCARTWYLTSKKPISTRVSPNNKHTMSTLILRRETSRSTLVSLKSILRSSSRTLPSRTVTRTPAQAMFHSRCSTTKTGWPKKCRSTQSTIFRYSQPVARVMLMKKRRLTLRCCIRDSWTRSTRTWSRLFARATSGVSSSAMTDRCQ